jgi:hypothetical protein
MKQSVSGWLRLAVAACLLLLAISLSTSARQSPIEEDPELPTAGVSMLPKGEPATVGTQPPAGSAQAQSQPQAQAQGEQKPANAEKHPDGQAQSGTSRDRIFFLLPNFLTLENAGNLPPLTTAQKFKTVARGTFDPVQFAYYGIIAGVGQAINDEPGYGQGMQGYAKRYASIFGDSTIENFMVGAVMPSILKQDPRYFQMGKGPFHRRAWYAITRIFVIRGDSGHAQFNASEIFGSALAAGASTYSYHPEDDRKFGNVVNTWGTQLGLDSFANMMKEFWPDFRRHFHKKGTAANTNPSGE